MSEPARPGLTEPVPTEPVPVDGAPVRPDLTTPAPTEPVPVDGAPVRPDLTKPVPTEPVPAPGDAALDADPAAAVTLPEPAADSRVWRRMHPVTPAIKGWRVLVGAIAVLGYQFGDDLRNAAELVGDGRWRFVVGGLVLVAAVGFVYALLAWRMTRFAVTDQAVHLHTGVLFRQQRQARLDRLQAVDVVQPLLARITGLAELKLEVAGGSGSAVSLAFLKQDEAEGLRSELLARAAGLHVEAGAPQGGPVVEAAPEHQVFEVPMARLVQSVLRSGVTLWAGVFVVPVIVGVVWTREPGAVFIMVPAFFGIAGAIWSAINQGANFRAAISPDGIRLRHGLTESRAQTVPPGRVQALGITQGPLWRGKDWWRVQMNVAGYGGAGEQQTENVLLPVGTRDDAVLALWLVLPDLGVADPRAVVEAGLSGSAADDAFGFLTVPRRARLLDLLAWNRRGVLVTDRALLVRSGRFIRRLVVVPHERTQSLQLDQGPLQRRFGVASLVVHSTPGPVSPRVDHLDAAVAAALLDEQAERARTARANAGPEQWMRREGTA
ncbi:PH domain-containing protein [Cellulomonas cellasea]|uniref:Putative membrane protein n=1 Tax=Cellulomonas cellasea TaxID=43670 RepID=A0A7W4YE75_9CELL|nr:PH domain-containing protein [Cellulomonas cellasea]MBB2925316.1 putative membrane protein [Cellulomonas cellasea]